jgi:DNA-binding protein H-NS
MPSKRRVIDLTESRTDDMAERAKRLVQEIAKTRTLLLNARELVEDDGPRFRNPQNPTQTWSGRGNPPGWVKREIARGKTVDSLLD